MGNPHGSPARQQRVIESQMIEANAKIEGDQAMSDAAARQKAHQRELAIHAQSFFKKGTQ